MADRQRRHRQFRKTGAQRQPDTETSVPGVAQIAYSGPETGQEREVPLPQEVFVVLQHAVATWGRERTHALLEFGAALVQPELTTIDRRRLDLALTTMERYVAQWDDPEELALMTTYKLLRDKDLTCEQAATYTSTLLDRRVTAAAWRKRVDRWAAQHGLPAPGAASDGDPSADDAEQLPLPDLP